MLQFVGLLGLLELLGFIGFIEFVGFLFLPIRYAPCAMHSLGGAEVRRLKMGIHFSNRILLSPNPFADFERLLSVVTMLNPSEEAMAK